VRRALDFGRRRAGGDEIRSKVARDVVAANGVAVEDAVRTFAGDAIGIRVMQDALRGNWRRSLEIHGRPNFAIDRSTQEGGHLRSASKCGPLTTNIRRRMIGRKQRERGQATRIRGSAGLSASTCVNAHGWAPLQTGFDRSALHNARRIDALALAHVSARGVSPILVNASAARR